MMGVNGFLGSWSQAIDTVMWQLHSNLPLLLHAFAWLAGVHLLNVIMGRRLCVLGIVPRTWQGLCGIVWAPLLHIHAEHLLSNLLILFILGSMVAINGQAVLCVVTAFVWVVGGFATWLLGRQAVHIGASGVAMGYFGFLLMDAYQHPGLVTVGVAAVGLYYLSSLFMSLMPTGRQDSWESHVLGFIAGLAASQCYPVLLSWHWVQQWIIPGGALS